jgi:hypothetical protein
MQVLGHAVFAFSNIIVLFSLYNRLFFIYQIAWKVREVTSELECRSRELTMVWNLDRGGLHPYV